MISIFPPGEDRALKEKNRMSLLRGRRNSRGGSSSLTLPRRGIYGRRSPASGVLLPSPLKRDSQEDASKKEKRECLSLRVTSKTPSLLSEKKSRRSMVPLSGKKKASCNGGTFLKKVLI